MAQSDFEMYNELEPLDYTIHFCSFFSLLLVQFSYPRKCKQCWSIPFFLIKYINISIKILSDNLIDCSSQHSALAGRPF